MLGLGQGWAGIEKGGGVIVLVVFGARQVLGLGGEHVVRCVNVWSLFCTPETNMVC